MRPLLVSSGVNASNKSDQESGTLVRTQNTNDLPLCQCSETLPLELILWYKTRNRSTRDAACGIEVRDELRRGRRVAVFHAHRKSFKKYSSIYIKFFAIFLM